MTWQEATSGAAFADEIRLSSRPLARELNAKFRNNGSEKYTVEISFRESCIRSMRIDTNSPKLQVQSSRCT